MLHGAALLERIVGMLSTQYPKILKEKEVQNHGKL
jgi:hypothetical protein